ncbi:MAG: hypothetical protein ACJ8GW_13700 [Massilia sp.]
MNLSFITRYARALAVSTVVALGIASTAFAQAGRGPTTPDEQLRVLALAKTADSDPLATMASADGRWFEKWADDVPDYQFGPDKGAFWFMNNATKNDLKRMLRFQHTVTIAAFQLQHHISDPATNPADLEAKTLAGVEGLLRAYESMLAKQPDLHTAALDDALALQKRGALADFVKALPPMPKR